MRIKNVNLEHFKNEPYQKYRDYLYNLLEEKGSGIVDTLLKNPSASNLSETSWQHIERRHVDMSEKDMVDLTLKTGQVQGIFATAYDCEPMDHEDIKDTLYTALWDLAEKIAQEFVDYAVPFEHPFIYNVGSFIGYGINEKFNLVRADSIDIIIKLSDDPFSETGIEIATAYPSIYDTGDIIKNKDALKKEYGLHENDMIRYKNRQKNRKSIKHVKELNKGERLGNIKQTFMENIMRS